MKNRDIYQYLEEKVDNYNKTGVLNGISDDAAKDCLIRQLVDSVKRVNFIFAIKSRNIDEERKNPASEIFDPLRGAIKYFQEGNLNEAGWLIFLFTHFGRHKSTKDNLLKSFYGRFGEENVLTYDFVYNNLNDVREWIGENETILRQSGKFSNHRKFQSIKAFSNSGTGATIKSYCDLIGPSHEEFYSNINRDNQKSPEEKFDYLYKLFFKNLVGFARLGVFDLVTMLGKIGFVEAIPGSPYIQNSTGPKKGTTLLFGVPENTSGKELNAYLQDFGKALDLPFAMQIVEDAVCNWQKDTKNYEYFSG